MNHTTQEHAILLAQALLSNPSYILPYKSSHTKENAKHIAELVKQITQALQNNDLDIKMNLQDKHATI